MMKWFTGGVGAALLGWAFLGMVGCAEDNEAAINAQAAKSSEADLKEVTKPTTDPRSSYKDTTSQFRKGAGYPGAKK